MAAKPYLSTWQQPSKECYAMLECYRNNVAILDNIFDESYRILEDCAQRTLASIKDTRELYASMPPKAKGRRKRVSKLETHHVDVENVPITSSPPSKKRNDKSSLAALAHIDEPQKEDVFRSPATVPPKPPRLLRSTTRLASLNASKKISQNYECDEMDQEKRRYLSRASKSKKSMVNHTALDPVVEASSSTVGESSAGPSGHHQNGAIAKKVIDYENSVSQPSTSFAPAPLTPALAIVFQDESPPASPMQVSSAVLNLTPSNPRNRPIVTCTPLNLKELLGRRTSRGTYLLPSVVHKFQVGRKSVDRRRSSLAKFHRCSEKKRVSSEPVINTLNSSSLQQNKNDDDDDADYESEVEQNEDQELQSELDKENEVVPISEEVVADSKQRSIDSVAINHIKPSIRRVSVVVSRHEPAHSSGPTTSNTPVVTIKKSRRCNTTSDRPVLRNKSHSSGYISSDGKRVQPYRRTPQLGQDSSKPPSAQRLRTRTQNTLAEMKRMEAIQMKERKFLDNLKKRDEALKNALDEKKRNREERLRKALKTRKENEKQKLIRLKEQEDEVKRIQLAIQKKRDQEESERQQRLAEQRRIIELRQAKREREKREAELQADREAQQMREKGCLEVEREQRECEGVIRPYLRLEKHEKQRALAEERMKKEAEHNAIALKVSVVNHTSNGVLEMQKKLSASSSTNCDGEAATNMNTTVIIDSGPSSSKTKIMNATITIDEDQSASKMKSNTYEMTPPRDVNKKLPLMNPNSYDISELKEDDSTDDELEPKKHIPSWAQGRALKMAALKQYRIPPNYGQIFPREELMLAPKLADMFSTMKPRYNYRTSSANWSSPLFHGETSSSSTPNT